MDIKTYVQICKFKETSKISSLHPHVVNKSEYTQNKLNIFETSVTYPIKHVYDHLKITTAPKVNETRHFVATSVNRFDNDRCHDGMKLKDHPTTHCNSGRGLREKKLSDDWRIHAVHERHGGLQFKKWRNSEG